MLKILSLVLLVSISVINTCGEQSGDPFSQRKDVVFKDAHGIGLTVDIFTPRGNANARAIVVVASGGWSSNRSKIRDLGRAGLFEVLCNHGYHVFAVRPGSISRFSAKDMVTHVEEGIRWVKTQANEYGFHPEHIGLFGASAGGHLASLTAVTNDSTTPQNDASVAAVAVFFPPTDFLNYGGKTLDPREEGRFSKILAGLAFREGVDALSDPQIREQTKAISPSHLVTAHAPPFLLVHGDADPAVPLQQSQTMLEALKDAGIDSQLIIKKGGAHPWPTIREEVLVIADWFDRKLQAKK
ncbi:MAG TPA: alpha/beta hydrolase [Verrucomicrobiales bacterium]|nr:alpha/beta hydrolase [Verrucomicrobiales bacterium]HIL68275.1 alpha/beta hydrolase [Verrucomicrobiota bacterium]